MIYLVISRHYRPQIYSDVNNVPPAYSALVLGAGLKPDGSVTPMLYDRVNAAVALYKSGKVKKLIMSGDNRFNNHNEPEAMMALAIKLGVKASDIQPDYAGRRTYDSCYRAKNIFSQGKLIIVTQSFHITRSMFLCENMGIEVTGFIADKEYYTAWDWNWYKVRDVFSLCGSIIDLFIKHPFVVGGEKVEI